ncbi:MAG: zinc ribbon domain-containing protein [Leptolyngbya sp. SIO1D8]|nr:zinc ribbon domain-containing protein [Leptolyngbya sp. SIO1D8]
MPLYEFKCDPCGVFDEWRSLADRNVPAYCPICQKLGKRVFSPPTMLSGSLRLRQEIQEPRLVSRDRETGSQNDLLFQVSADA